MVVIIERRQMSLFLKDDAGMYRRIVFAEMADSKARQLVKEYGYKPEWVYAILHEVVGYRYAVDDSLVQAAMSRRPYKERYSADEWLAAVRTIVPQAARIVRLRGTIRK